MKTYAYIILILILFSCSKEKLEKEQVNVFYEVYGKHLYNVSITDENGKGKIFDSVTTGWNYQKPFSINVNPRIEIYRIGDTSFTDVSVIRIYKLFTKYESFDTSYSNKHHLEIK